MKKIFNYIAIFSVSAAFISCSSEEDIVTQWIGENEIDPPSAGTLDLSNYVSVGNSLTAGFADAALFPEGQENSLASIVAGQLALAGGGEFVYPDISSGNGFGGVDGMNILGRSFIDLETALAAIAGVEGVEVGDAIQFTEGTLLNTSTNTGSDLNNFGVPGARVTDLTRIGYGDATLGNPFFAQFATSGTTTILADAVSANASLFSLWIGSNDVLGFAIDGGNDTPNAAGTNVLTSDADFTTNLTTVLDGLSANGAEGVVLNIPPVTIIPFFQTVTELGGGINLIPLESQAQVDAVNAGYAAYNAGLDALVGVAPNFTQEEADLRKITFAVGANPPVITDESLTDLTGFNPALINMRQAKVDAATGASDLFPLTALSVIGAESIENDPTSVYGVGVPVPDESTLTTEEQAQIITKYATFNAIIAGQVAARDNLTLVDVGPLFADMYGLIAAQAMGLGLSEDAQAAADGELGILVGGIDLVPLSLSQEAIFNSVWSTDGIHPNPRGAALVANEIIDALNAKYGSSIPTVNPLDYPGVNAPF